MYQLHLALYSRFRNFVKKWCGLKVNNYGIRTTWKCLRLVNTHKFKGKFLRSGESDPNDRKILTLWKYTITVSQTTFLAMEVFPVLPNSNEPYFSRMQVWSTNGLIRRRANARNVSYTAEKNNFFFKKTNLPCSHIFLGQTWNLLLSAKRRIVYAYCNFVRMGGSTSRMHLTDFFFFSKRRIHESEDS